MTPWLDLFLVTFVQALAWVSAVTVVYGLLCWVIIRVCFGGPTIRRRKTRRGAAK